MSSKRLRGQFEFDLLAVSVKLVPGGVAGLWSGSADTRARRGECLVPHVERGGLLGGNAVFLDDDVFLGNTFYVFSERFEDCLVDFR